MFNAAPVIVCRFHGSIMMLEDADHMKTRFTICCATLLLAIGAASDLRAVEVYTWVDENGVTHFSDTGPEDSAQPVRKLMLENPAPADVDEDVFGVEAQAARMQALRETMEARRSAALEARRQAAQQPVVQYVEQPGYGYPIFSLPGYPARPPYRPPTRPPRPEPYPSAPFKPLGYLEK
jgi:hypothetical protein